MANVFSLHIEFDRDVFTNKIFTLIKERRKGYVCVIDGNVLAMTYRDRTYQDIVNAACINTCDGSSIAMMVNWIYKAKIIYFQTRHFIISRIEIHCCTNTKHYATIQIRQDFIHKFLLLRSSQ